MKIKLSVKQIVLLITSVILNIFGLMLILQINGANMGVGFVNKISNMLYRYLIVLTVMPAGIILFSTFATTFEGKIKKILAIINCAYGTILTIPFVVSMIICFIILGGTSVPFMDAFVEDIAILIPNIGGQIVFFIFATIVSIVFLIEPPIGCYLTVKDVEPSIPNIILFLTRKKSIGELISMTNDKSCSVENEDKEAIQGNINAEETTKLEKPKNNAEEQATVAEKPEDKASEETKEAEEPEDNVA